MLKKFLLMSAMALEGSFALALGVFALNLAGSWGMEFYDEAEGKIKKFIHEKTAEKEEAKEPETSKIIYTEEEAKDE